MHREDQLLNVEELPALAVPVGGPCGDLVLVLGLGGLHRGEVAGLQVRDLVVVGGATA